MKMKIILVILLVVVVGLFSEDVSAEIIPADRKIDWSQAGAKTDFSARTTICTTLSPSGGNDASAIQNAIASCLPGQVVKLDPGTFNIDSTIMWGNNPYVTLRGSGKGVTVLKGQSGFSGSRIFDFYSNRESSPDYGWTQTPTVALSSGLNKHSTQINTAGNHNWVVGDYVLIDQLNNAAGDPPEINLGCGWCSRDNGNRLRAQVVKITNVVDSNTVDISPALYFDYDTRQSPEGKKANIKLEGISLESLTIDNHDSDAPVMFYIYNLFDSLFYDIDMDGIPAGGQSRHFHIYNSLWLTIRHSDIHGGEGDQTNQGYGMFFGYSTSGILVEDSTFSEVILATAFEGATSGNVIAYCHTTNSLWYDTSANRLMIINHGGGSANLIEGNFIEGRYREDSYFASGHWNTVVRNRIEQQQGKSDQLHTYDIERGHHYNTAVGNVLGTLGHETNYEQAGSGSAPAIYRLGYDSPWGSYVDSQVIATMLRHGNWDSVNNGVVWDPGISDHNIPASFYLSSIPEWWCSETPWPPIGPDVAGYTNDIPAKRRYEGSICTMGSTSPECSDGDDNDGDGQIDYPTDAGCINANDDDESNCGDTACEGGETCLTCSQDCDSDSDGDSYNSELCGGNDCNDNNPNINQRATEVCSGGADDDCDGQIDCNDIDCSSLPSCQAPPICQDLDLLMHFDVDSSAAVDDSGNGNDATCSGASCPVFGSGRPGFGGAFDYDGTDDQFDLSTFTLGSEFTYSVWIRPDATTSWTTIMAEPGPSGNPIRWLGLLDMQVNWYDNSNNLFGSALSPGSWYYLALSYDGSDVIVYLNGAQIGSPYTPSPYTSVTDSFVIGNNFIGTQAFDGIIDEVAIWNRALSSQEISDIYNSGQPITCLTQYHRADNNPQNGCIRENELTAFITLWKQDSTTYPMREMMDAISLWRAGTGCS